MKFNKVTAENFKSIGNEPISVNLNFTDVKLLLGTNGVGKSTIFDAIIWCLYGFTRTKADSIVNKTTKCGTKVELDFDESGKKYVITRYRKHKEHGNNVYIFEEGKPITLKDSRQNQELILSIIGVDYKALSSSVILSSETYKNFLREKGSARLSIFESVFSLKEINEFNKKNKLKIKEISKELNDKENILKNTNTSISSKMFILNSYKEEKVNKKIERENEIKSLKERISLLEKLIEKSKEIDISKEKDNIISNKSKIEEKKNLLQRKEFFEKDIEDLISRRDYDKNEYETALAEISKIDSIDVEKELEDIKNFSEDFNRLSSEKGSLSIKLSKIENERNALHVKLKRILDDYEKILIRKKELEHVNICPTCKGIIGKELHDELVAKNNKEVNDIEKEKDDLITISIAQNVNLKEEIEELISKNKISFKKAQDNLETLRYSKEYLLGIKDKKEELYGKLILKTNLDIANDRIFEENKELDNIITLLSSYDDIIVSKFTIDSLNELEKKNIEYEISIKTLKNELSVLDKKPIDENTDYIVKIMNLAQKESDSAKKLKIEVEKIKEKLIYYTTFDTILSNNDDGFKKYFIKNTIGMFNEKINMFLPFFFDDEISITFDKNLSETILFRGEDTEFEELSSGQKTRCELSVIFSMYFLVRVLFGNGSNLLVLDEILDYNLDIDGVESVMKIIKDFSKESSVFVVSHRDEYKDNFENVIKVFTDELGFTKIL